MDALAMPILLALSGGGVVLFGCILLYLESYIVHTT